VSANVKKRALVTGGSGVIGAAICRLLAERGFHVLVHANTRQEQAQQLARTVVDQGGDAEPICFDVADRAACAAALEPLTETQAVQVIVHNAGVHDDAPFAGMSGEQWDRVLNVSLNGFYNVVRPLLLHMIATRWGRIICTSSVAGILGNRGQVNYAAAKAGLHGAIRALAVEVGSRGITANVVAPGIIQSDMASKFSEQQISQLVPIGRAGRAEEVAAVVAFLASEDAAYVSGQIIGVNGAMI